MNDAGHDRTVGKLMRGWKFREKITGLVKVPAVNAFMLPTMFEYRGIALYTMQVKIDLSRVFQSHILQGRQVHFVTFHIFHFRISILPIVKLN